MDPDVDRPARPPMPRDVRNWRRDVLRQAGFDEQTARRLAADDAVDLHDLLELVDRGCPPDLAARILEPL